MSSVDSNDDVERAEEYKRYIAQLPRQLTPFYDAEPNEPITLYQGKMTLAEEDGHETTSNGKLFASWFPTPDVRFKLEADPIDRSSWFLIMSPMAKLKVSALNLEIEAQMTRMSPGIAEGFISPNISVGTDADVSYLLLHIVNFVDYIGEPIAASDTQVTSAQIVMENDDWQFTIHALPESKKRIEKLRKEYGYAITHVGKLESKHNETFSTVEAVKIVDKLDKLFSFIRGAEAISFLTVGFDATGSKVWERWGSLSSNNSSMNSKRSWLPYLPTSSGLSQLFTGYMNLQANESWSEVINSAINWYIRSSYTASAEVAIVFAQMGIELLSWAKFVEIEQHMSKDGFGRLPNADRMTLLLSTLSIPTLIPDELAELNKYAKANNMAHGTQVITTLRNNIVHPELRMRIRNLSPLAQIEAIRLSLWYLELSLLKLCKYEGMYSNRLKTSWQHLGESLP